MERDQLVRLLKGDNDALTACRLALLAGARFDIPDDVEPMPASHFATIYARREVHTRERGVPTVGFAQAVDDLRAHGDSALRIGSVDVDEPPYHYQLFLDAHLTTVVACLGVDRQLDHRPAPGE